MVSLILGSEDALLLAAVAFGTSLGLNRPKEVMLLLLLDTGDPPNDFPKGDTMGLVCVN